MKTIRLILAGCLLFWLGYRFVRIQLAMPRPVSVEQTKSP